MCNAHTVVLVFSWVAMFSAKGKRAKLSPKLEVLKYTLIAVTVLNTTLTSSLEYKQYDVRFTADSNKIMNGTVSFAKLMIGGAVLLSTMTGSTMYALRIASLSSSTTTPAASSTAGNKDTKSSKKKKKKKTGAGTKRLLYMFAAAWSVSCMSCDASIGELTSR